MRTSVDIKTSAFEGAFVCAVEIREWKRLVQELRQLEASIGRDAAAAWCSMEANIEFRFTLHKLGALECVYRFSPNVISLGPTLSGKFDADQTFLLGWIRDAEQAPGSAR